MALIPPDVGLQLRAQADAQLQPVAPARLITVDLPDLHVGQTFTARVQEAMPENIYKALVAGKMITLHLPEGAKTGDLLELVVVDRTPRMLIAQQVPRAPMAEGAQHPYPFATFSRAARMIGQLLVPEGETPEPALLNRGQPLLQKPSMVARDMLPALKAAISQSGMFYESHQAQWVAGKLPLASLLHEPQGQMSQPTLLAAHRLLQEAATGSGESATPGRQPLPATPAPTSLAGLPRSAEAVETNKAGVSPTPTAAPGQGVEGELRPLVQQQLEAAAAQRLMWQGEIWPGQAMDWRIEWERQRNEGDDDADHDDEEAEGDRWRTTLALTTPRMGRIEATLQLEGGGVRIAIAAPDAAGASDLREAIPALAAALEAAGVAPLSIQVKHGTE